MCYQINLSAYFDRKAPGFEMRYSSYLDIQVLLYPYHVLFLWVNFIGGYPSYVTELSNGAGNSTTVHGNL